MSLYTCLHELLEFGGPLIEDGGVQGLVCKDHTSWVLDIRISKLWGCRDFL